MDELEKIQFVKTYQSEYDVTDLLLKNKLMPFDELADIPKPQERLLNKYFLKVTAAIDKAVWILPIMLGNYVYFCPLH